MQGSDASLRERRMRVLRWWWRCKRRTGEWRKERGEEHCERSVHPPPPSLLNER
jgi:ribosomal protein L32E